MIYKTIEIQIWEDKEIRKLSDEGKLLFVYLKTNRLTHYSGIYIIRQSYIMEDLKWSKPKLIKTLKELQLKPFIEYDEENDIIWIINMLNYSLKIGNQVNLIKGIGKHLGTLCKSFTLCNFHNKYKHLDIPIPMGYGWVLDPSNTVTVTSTVTDTVILLKDDKPKIDVKNKYGKFENVLLTDKELETLKKEHTDWKEKIDNLSHYIGSKGDTYKSHYMTILSWARKEKPKQNKLLVNNKDFKEGVNEDGTF